MISENRLRCFIFVYRLVEKTRDNVYATVKLFMSGRTSQPQLVNRFFRVCSSFLQTFGKEKRRVTHDHRTIQLLRLQRVRSYDVTIQKWEVIGCMCACIRMTQTNLSQIACCLAKIILYLTKELSQDCDTSDLTWYLGSVLRLVKRTRE